MPRRQIRRREPNQRTCKHTFFKLYNRTEQDQFNPNALRVDVLGRRGSVLQCAKCALVRTLWNDGTMVDGGVSRTPVQQNVPQGQIATGLGTAPHFIDLNPRGDWNTFTTNTVAELTELGRAALNRPNERQERRTAAQHIDDNIENGEQAGV